MVERGETILGEAKITHEVKVARTGCQFDGLGVVTNDFKASLAARSLHQASYVFLDHRAAQFWRHGPYQLITAQDPLHVRVVEDPLDSRESECRAGDTYFDRAWRRCGGP